MMVYKVFRKSREGKELIGTLPERRSQDRITKESIEKYMKSIFGPYTTNGEITLEPEKWES